MADAEQTSPWKKLGRLMDEAINTRMPWEAEVESRKETPQQEASIGYTMKEELLRGLPEGTSRVRMPAGTAVFRLPDGTCKAFVPTTGVESLLACSCFLRARALVVDVSLVHCQVRDDAFSWLGEFK